MKFSNTTYSFYSEDLLDKYKNPPEDLQDVIDEDYVDFCNNVFGSLVKLNSDGRLQTRTIKTDLTKEQILYASKQNRDAAVDADILFGNVYFQVTNDCADIKSSLQEASVLGLEDSYSQLWRLADNTWRQTTIAEAKQIVALFVARKQKVWAAFAEWDLGDKSSVFTYEEPFIENTTNSVVQETSQTGV